MKVFLVTETQLCLFPMMEFALHWLYLNLQNSLKLLTPTFDMVWSPPPYHHC